GGRRSGNRGRRAPLEPRRAAGAEAEAPASFAVLLQLLPHRGLAELVAVLQVQHARQDADVLFLQVVVGSDIRLDVLHGRVDLLLARPLLDQAAAVVDQLLIFLRALHLAAARRRAAALLDLHAEQGDLLA